MMSNSTEKTINDIDWAALRANAMDRKGWKSKGPKEWDAKAGSFSGRNKDSGYIDIFLSRLPLGDSLTVLDVGSGPGTLAIPIAREVSSVTAMDFSPGMLTTLNQRAAEEGIENIRTVQCAWEDDWSAKGIPPHDIAIASRSMGVKDLRSALVKINRNAKKYVFISDRIGPTPFEAAAFSAIGRSFHPGPDYIYTINTLYTLGIHANLTVLEIDRDVHYSSMDAAFSSFQWMFQDLTVQEEGLLKDYIETRVTGHDAQGFTVRRETPVRWALIWWKTTTQ